MYQGGYDEFGHVPVGLHSLGINGEGKPKANWLTKVRLKMPVKVVVCDVHVHARVHVHACMFPLSWLSNKKLKYQMQSTLIESCKCTYFHPTFMSDDNI